MLHADHDDEWTLVFDKNNWISIPDEEKYEKHNQFCLVFVSQRFQWVFSVPKNNWLLNKK